MMPQVFINKGKYQCHFYPNTASYIRSDYDISSRCFHALIATLLAEAGSENADFVTDEDETNQEKFS